MVKVLRTTVTFQQTCFPEQFCATVIGDADLIEFEPGDDPVKAKRRHYRALKRSVLARVDDVMSRSKKTKLRNG